MFGDDNKRKGSPSDGSNQNVNKKAKPSQTPQRRPPNQPELTNPSGTDTANRRTGQQTQGSSKPREHFISNFQIRLDLTLQELLDAPPASPPSSDLDTIPLNRAPELDVSNEALRDYFDDYIKTTDELRERVANIEQVPFHERKISDYADEYFGFDGITYGPKGPAKKKKNTSSGSVSSRTSTGTQPGTSGFAYPRPLPLHLSGIKRPGTSNSNPRPVPSRAGTSGLNTIMPDRAGAPAYIDLTDDGTQGVLSRDKGPGKAKTQAKSETQTRPLPPAADQPAQQPAGQSIQQPVGQSVQQPAVQPAVQTNNQDTSDILGLDEHFRNTRRQLSDDLELPLDIFYTPLSPDCDDNKRRRRRSVCSLKDQQLKKKVTQFVNAINKQTVNFRTKIVFSDSSGERTDISSYSIKPGTVLAEIQNQINDFRERRANQAFDQHTVQGFNSIVVFDKASIPKTINQTNNKPATEVLYFDAESTLLFSKYGEVVTRIPGGEYNRLSLIGTVGDFKQLAKAVPIDKSKPSLLKAFIKKFCHKNSIGNVQIQTTDGTTDNLKSLVQDFESIRRDTLGSIGSISFNSAEGADPEYRLFPGESNALQVSRTSTSTPLSRSVLPGSFIKLPELDNPPDASESLPEKVDDKPSDILTIAATRSELRQRLLEFDMAFMAIRDKHNLADDVVPVLDSLTREGDGWRMDFMQPDSGTKTSIAFESGAFHRFKTFISDVQNGGTQRSGKSRQTGGMDAAQTFADLPDMIEGFVTLGSKQHKRARPAGMTDAQYRTYLGRQYLFYIAMAVQGAELVDLGAKGVKLLIPSFKKLAPGLGQTGLPSSLSSIRKLSKAFKAVGKSARFIPILGFSTQLANLSLTIDAYLSEKDPDVKKLLEAQLIFDSIDTAVSGLSEFAGPAAYPIDFVMYLARDIFDSIYGEKFKQLRFEKVRDASKAAAKTFNSLYAALDPDNFIAKRANSINFLVDGSGKNRLPMNVKEVNLVDSTFRFGAVYSYKQTYIPGPHEWKYCTRQQYHGKNHSGKWCREYDNKIEYSDQFDMVSNALKTLCKTENRLRTYQCADGVFKNVDFTGNTIFMTAAPEWKIKLHYSDYERRAGFSDGELHSNSPGAKFLHAINDDQLKQSYEARVKKIKAKSCAGWGAGCKTTYTYQHIGKMFTHTKKEEVVDMATTSTLYMDNNHYKVVFRGTKEEANRLLTYKVYEFEGARQHYALISDSTYTVKVYPGKTSRSVWALAYDGKTPYTCIAENDSQVRNCRLTVINPDGNHSRYGMKVTLGQSNFVFQDTWVSPSTQDSHRIIGSDENAQFEFLPSNKIRIHYLFHRGEINETRQRAEKLKNITARYASSRFVEVILKDCTKQRPGRGKRTVSCFDCDEDWPRVKGLDTVLPFPGQGLIPKTPVVPTGTYYNCHYLPDRSEQELRRYPRPMIWFDKDNQVEIKLLVPGSEVVPVQGSPETGYYFLDKATNQLFFKKIGFLKRDINRLDTFDCNTEGACFGPAVTMTNRTANPNRIVVANKNYYYLATASASGTINEELVGIITTPGTMATDLESIANQGILKLRVVDSRDRMNTVSAGFYDLDLKLYITYLSSLFDGDHSSGANTQEIDNKVLQRLENEHVPVHRIINGQAVIYVVFSKHSGNLLYLEASAPGKDDSGTALPAQRIASGFKVVRPASEQLASGSIAGHPVFTRVTGYRNSVLAVTDNNLYLRIPDDAWSKTTSVGSTQNPELRGFNHWKIGKGEATVARSTDTMSLQTFGAQSGVILESLDLGMIVNSTYSSVFGDSDAPAWTESTTQRFITSLKTRINDLVNQAKNDYFAIAELVKLSIITDLVNSRQLAFMKQQDFWYHSSGTLLMAPAAEAHKIIGSDGNKLITVPKGKHHRPGEFFLQSKYQQGARHPYCGNRTVYVRNRDIPTEFYKRMSVPCVYQMYNPVPMVGDYQWDQGQRAWNIKTPYSESFEANHEYFKLTSLDISRHPRDTLNEQAMLKQYSPLESVTRSDYGKSMAEMNRKNPYLRSTPVLSSLTLRSEPFPDTDSPDNQVRAGWYDQQNDKVYFGLPGENFETLTLIGGRSAAPAQGLIYHHKTKTLSPSYGSGKSWIAGPFENVKVVNKGIYIQGTQGKDSFNLDRLHLDYLYLGTEPRVLNAEGTPRDFSVYLEGNGGPDSYHLKAKDLTAFSNIVIAPGIHDPSAGGHPGKINFRSPSFLYAARRGGERGQDLILSNRFDPDAARVIVKQVWPGLYDQPLVPTTIKFADTSVTLKELATMISDKGGTILFPMRINEGTPLNLLYNVHATGQQPLLIELDAGFQAVPEQTSSGIKITFTAPDNAYKSSVIIPDYAFASGSVMIRQKNDYHILQYDGGRGVRHNLASISLKEQTIERDGHQLVVSKTHPVPVSITHVKYVMKEKNDAGYPVVSRHQLDVQKLTLDSKKRYAQVGRNRPDKAGRYYVDAVFYNTASPDDYRFTFENVNGQLHWKAHRGNVLTREGVLGKKQTSFTILLKDTNNLSSYYQVVPGELADLRLTPSPDQKNRSQMVIGSYRQHLGKLTNTGFKPLKEALKKAISSGLPNPVQGFILAGSANQQTLSLDELATYLNKKTVLIKEPTPGDSRKMEGNHLDNVLYAGADSGLSEIKGRGGDDLILLASPKKKATDVTVLRPSRRGDRCDNRQEILKEKTGSLNLNFTVDGGAGNDIYIPERNVRINDSKGDHSVFISKTSGADLRGLSGEKSTTLFVDMEYDTTLFSLCDRETGSLLTLMTKKQVTEAEVPDLSRQDIHVYSTEHNGLVALANLSTLKRIHFLKDNKMTDDPVSLITGRNNVLTNSENSEDLQAIKDRTSAARNEIRALPEGSADTEIVNRLGKLVESLSAFSTTTGGNSPIPTAPASQNATGIFTSPIVNTTSNLRVG